MKKMLINDWLFTSVLAILFSTVVAPYSPDCSANTRLRCYAEEGTCEANPVSDDFPAAPYDLRVSQYIVANPNKKPDMYQLWVNVSWRPTHEGTINKTRGFELVILNKETNRQQCFTLHLVDPSWDDKDRHESTRFHFTTEDLFEFGATYFVEVQSLPKASSQTPKGKNFIGQDVTMPGHPDRILATQLNQTGYFERGTFQNMAVDFCSSSPPDATWNLYASRWIAAYRYVYVQPKLRSIYVEFIAAPTQYCFEVYELRIFKHGEHQGKTVKLTRENLTHEAYGDVMVAFGNYTFRDVDVGMYDIGVSPIAYSEVGRCLCPLPHQSCSCSMSIWPDVQMPEAPTVVMLSNPCDYLPPVKLPYDCPMKDANSTYVDESGNETAQKVSVSGAVVALVSVLIVALIIIAFGIGLLLSFYRRYKRKNVTELYLLPMTNTETEMTNGSISSKKGGLTRPVTLTIIYSHDCLEYERTVQNLVDYLNSQCFCDVRVDYLCAKEISANKFDWAYKSIQEADRVLLLNSYGAYLRYQAKIHKPENGAEETTIIERADGSEFDDLFLLQLDLLVKEYQTRSQIGPASTKIISARFPFTSDEYVLPHAKYIRYELPKHFRPLIIDLHHLPFSGHTDEDDENEAFIPAQLKMVNKDEYEKCVEGRKLKESLESMTKLIHDKPDWFEQLHVRRAPVVKEERPIAQKIDPESVRLLTPVEHPKPRDWNESGEATVSSTNQIAQEILVENPIIPDEAGPNASSQYSHFVDSGVAVSADKQSDSLFSSPKHSLIRNGKPNGLIRDGNDDELVQRLIV